MINRGPFGTGQEGAPGLTTQAEPFLFQIPPQTIQVENNTQKSHQDQKTTPLCRLYIWKVLQEAMEDKRQTLRQVNEKILGNQTRYHDLN